MSDCPILRRAFPGALVLVFLFQPLVRGQNTGTFVDREQPTDLRILSYNVLTDSIFESETARAKLGRILHAVEPDVITLQEVFDHTSAETRDVIDALYPSPSGGTWYVHQGRGNVTLSRYPLLMPAVRPTPSGHLDLSMTLIDLPDDQFAANLYLMNTHNDHGEAGGANRGRQVDSMINWMRDARTLGGEITLAPGTPMIALGTMNFSHGNGTALTRLIAGDVNNTATYGSDSPPDWDGSPLTDAHPYHNGITPEESSAAADYTWRSEGSEFPPGIDNNVVFTDSVFELANHFILNTTLMTQEELDAFAGELLADDVLRNATPNNFDNLPIVVDFRIAAPALPGDFDRDGIVSNLDYLVWKSTYNSATQHAADANADGLVDAVDYTVWRNNRGMQLPNGAGGLTGALSHIPEPSTWTAILIAAAISVVKRSQRGRSRLY